MLPLLFIVRNIHCNNNYVFADEVFHLIKLLFFSTLLFMGYVFNFNDAISYEEWFNNPRNRFAADLESSLMIDLLKPMRGETVLEIGCGTGAFLLPFLELDLQVTGLDPSPYMLDIALNTLGNRVDLYRGFAEDLPFEDN